MTSSIERRVDAIVTELRTRGKCTTCYGVGPHPVFVPEGADENAPEYTPTACPECGVAPRRLMRIIGMDLCQVEKTFGPLQFQPRPTGCD